MGAGRLREAAELFQRSIDLCPHFKALELLGETRIRLNEHQKAIVPLAAATTLNRQGRAPSLLAEAFLTLGKSLEAAEMAETALQRDPKNRKALEVLRLAREAHDRRDR